MTILLPTGDVIDTTGTWLKFVAGGGSPTSYGTLNLTSANISGASQVLEATSQALFQYIQQQTAQRMIAGEATLILTSTTPPTITSATSAAEVLTINGTNFQTGALVSVEPANATAGAPTALVVTSYSAGQLIAAYPSALSGTSVLVTVINPDGGNVVSGAVTLA